MQYIQSSTHVLPDVCNHMHNQNVLFFGQFLVLAGSRNAATAADRWLLCVFNKAKMLRVHHDAEILCIPSGVTGSRRLTTPLGARELLEVTYCQKKERNQKNYEASQRDKRNIFAWLQQDIQQELVVEKTLGNRVENWYLRSTCWYLTQSRIVRKNKRCLDAYVRSKLWRDGFYHRTYPSSSMRKCLKLLFLA